MKIIKYENDELIGRIPIFDYILYLYNIKCGKERAIKRTKEIYNCDITDVVMKMDFITEYDPLYEFANNFKILDIMDNGSRGWYQRNGRKRYIRYLAFISKKYSIPQVRFLDFFTWNSKVNIEAHHVHHIHPLSLGGNNDVENLIFINKFNHEILHINPRQGDFISNNMSVDYLYYLYNGAYSELVSKYKHDRYCLEDVIEKEMILFYESCNSVLV